MRHKPNSTGWELECADFFTTQAKRIKLTSNGLGIYFTVEEKSNFFTAQSDFGVFRSEAGFDVVHP